MKYIWKVMIFKRIQAEMRIPTSGLNLFAHLANSKFTNLCHISLNFDTILTPI